MEKQLDFETAISQLQDIVTSIETGDCSLDEAITLFEKGIELSDKCTKMLSDAKQKITDLSSKTGDNNHE